MKYNSKHRNQHQDWWLTDYYVWLFCIYVR